MKSTGGASTSSEHRYRPKALLFGVLTLLWIFPSAGAVVILSRGTANWREAAGLLDWLSRVRLEEWAALTLLGAQLLFAWLALRYRRTEPLREVPVASPGIESSQPTPIPRSPDR